MGGGGGEGGRVVGVNGGCGRRIDVFVKIQKKILGGGSGGGLGRRGGGWGDVIEELKILGKFTKKIKKNVFFMGGGVGSGRVGVGVRVDVNEELKFL